MSQLLTPVYTIQEINSTSKPVGWENIDIIARQIGEGYIVLWQHHAIFVGEVKGNEVTWLDDIQPAEGDKHLVRMRAFSEAQEYHYWRSGGNIHGRLRMDAPGEGQEVVDTSMMLRGGVGKLWGKEEKDKWAVVTRNYIDYDDTNQQVGYVDSRFVKFQPFNSNNP